MLIIVLIESISKLRPKHYTNSVDLMFGPVTNVDPTDDLNFLQLKELM